MYTVGDLRTIICTLPGVPPSDYTWIDEEGNTVTNGARITLSANDSIHHKTFTCFGYSLTTLENRSLPIKIVINGK